MVSGLRGLSFSLDSGKLHLDWGYYGAIFVRTSKRVSCCHCRIREAVLQGSWYTNFGFGVYL